MEQIEWVTSHFVAGALPPFSFIYDGQLSTDFLTGWQFHHETSTLDDKKTVQTFTYTNSRTGLEVRCVCEVFQDFPAVEWVLHFKNTGTSDTPIIEDVQVLDTTLMCTEGGEVILHRALGSSASRMDFAPIDEVVKPNTQIRFAPVGGRSSNTSAFPFFNVEFPLHEETEGVVVGIGWSGQWAASLTRNSGTGLTVRAGMEGVHLRLHPDEQIRTPRILLLFWKGDHRMEGHNLLRRFILSHHTLQKEGQPVTAPLACVGSPRFFDESNTGAEFNDATEHNQIEFARRYRELGLETEYWWIDAGWFEGRWPNGVGNWFIRKDGFPNGLRPVSDAVKQLGMGFLLWFEPERVYQGTWLDREHPEWVLKLPDRPNGLLNLGNHEARRWLTGHISGMIEREGISIYRQDFNMDPLPYWHATDKPDRQGITEIRHIEGLYAFWDELLSRHPGLIIDNCASGGRRIDLETTSRSIPLWRTDYHYFEPNGYQSHTCGLNFSLPLSGTGSGSPDTYAFRSSMNSAVVLAWNLYAPDFPVEQAQRLIAEFMRVRPFFYGDFYPLTAHSVSDDVWMAYQFHREDMRQGVVLAFRRPESPYLSARLKLCGLHPEAQYDLTFEDTGVRQTLTGEALCRGIIVTIEEAPGSVLITYRQT
ncbi:MAG: alpha-galactosidase [Candidatus Latescibacteria bacterium]|nr:alpha-galactosidase [Candidatus Latescibacterota bacterium]